MTGTNICFHDEVLDFLFSSPTPAQIIAFQVSDPAQERLRTLVAASQSRSLTEAEQAELDAACEMVQLFKRLKAKARSSYFEGPSAANRQTGTL
jgi:hypothetical protein